MAPHDLVAPQPVESEVIIETRGLSRVYPGVTALDNVNYRVYRNKVNVLIGENGAGKSTMMKMLAGVETPSSGQIILDGEAVSFPPPGKLSSMVKQFHYSRRIRQKNWASVLFFRN
ncbi:sugar ABC transporter ATP-binding protein [Klebsiella pneumoniae]|nr:sugar ABC transporter ATP-binding protein [Klebsiella pneumoniae]